MFDENISGELPEHIDFIKNKAIPVFESWGYETKILHSDKTYLDCFHHVATKGKRIGKKLGFPMSGKCKINSECKIKQIKKFVKEIKGPFAQYVGIAVDEPTRMNRIVNSCDKISLLKKYGYTEQMAFDLCKKYNLLSPIYEFTNRGGCWFCPNMRYAQLKHLRTYHRDLWQKLLELENEPDLIGNMWNSLNKTSIHQKEEEFRRKEKSDLALHEYLKNNNLWG